MKGYQRIGLLFLAWAQACAGFPVAESVDPRFPSELQAAPADDWSPWPWVRIKQLERAREQLLENISVLPRYDLKSWTQYLGYHSLFEADDIGDSPASTEILINVSSDTPLDSIALAPAFNPEQPGAYAFPKRFKIEVRNSRAGEFITVVNWLDEDFPDPGPYPAFFEGIDHRVKQIRITAQKVEREPGVAYMALGEIYLFRRKEANQLGDNIAMWDDAKTEASDSLSVPPIWDIQYLADGVDGFGLPLSDETVASEDFLIGSREGAELSDQVVFILDLGQLRNIGPIEFWPATPPHRMALPSYGFPGKITVELSTNPDFSQAESFPMEDADRRTPHSDLLSIKCKGARARYIRIAVEGLSEVDGKKILGLGEILVSNNDDVWSTGCKVTVQGIPDAYLDQLPRLVDGCSSHRRILPQGEQIRGLAMRRPLDRRLAIIDHELEKARKILGRLQLRLGMGGGGLIAIGLLGGLLLQRHQRQRGLLKLKKRITRDLHDEVGSSLAGISLGAGQLERLSMDTKVRDGLGDLSLLAREACSSLREVVWVIDQSTIRLPALIDTLSERARWILGGMIVSVETPEDCPEEIVSLTFKRHLIMYFKEVVHNCARHAQASRVRVVFSVADRQLRILVADNGCGFDPSVSSGGWGLASMKNRAQELGGTMDLSSRPGEGTLVVLNVPLSKLSKEPNKSYKTSN